MGTNKVIKKKKPVKCKKTIKTIKPPSKNDPLYKFYTSLFRQNPKSDMAIKWLCSNGLGHMVINFEGLNLKS